MGISLENLGIAVSGIPGGANYGLYRELKKGNGYVPPGASNRPPRMAGDVKLLDPLKQPLTDINTKRQGALSTELGRINANTATSNNVFNRPTGQYQGHVIGQAGTRASSGIEDALGGVLGSTSLQDAKNEQEYQDNVALAKEIGALNAPSMLQTLLSLGSAGAESGAQFKGLYDSIGNKKQKTSSSPEFGSSSNPYSFDKDSFQGYKPYDYERYWR